VRWFVAVFCLWMAGGWLAGAVQARTPTPSPSPTSTFTVTATHTPTTTPAESFSLSGVILEYGSGAPVVGAELTISKNYAAYGQPRSSDDAGRYEIPALEWDRQRAGFQVTVSAAGYISQTIYLDQRIEHLDIVLEREDLNPSNTGPAVAALSPTTFVVTGYVRNQDRKALPGAKVSYTNNQGLRIQTTADAEGRFVMAIPAPSGIPVFGALFRIETSEYYVEGTLSPSGDIQFRDLPYTATQTPTPNFTLTSPTPTKTFTPSPNFTLASPTITLTITPTPT